MERDNGGPAFPSEPSNTLNLGMSMRDYFAGQALCGNIASFAGYEYKYPSFKQFAEDAYKQADAMLKERNK